MRGWLKKDDRLFTLDVYLISGPITEEFAKKNMVISRTIQIRGDQTLEDLHHAIFNAFGREEEHMHEFQIGGKGPMDPKARRYVLPGAFEEPIRGPRKPDGDLTLTIIGSLGLRVNDVFGYWFDFGDDWWHQINVVAVGDSSPRGRYPKVIKRMGENPPQYVDWDLEGVMVQDLEQIEYRCGMLKKGMKAKILPVKVWRGAKIPSEVRKAIREENLLNLGGVYGDKKAGDPVQYDQLKLILTDDTVEITVFNRGIALLMSDDERIKRIHRVLCRLDTK